MSKTILVTGSAGYIGSIATYLLLERGDQVVGLDNLSTGHQGAIDFLKGQFPQRFSFYQTDTRENLDQVFTENPQIEAVLHYAAALSVDESMKNPQKYFSINVAGTNNLLTTMINHNVKNLVFSSTAATYGPVDKIPIEESENPTPVNVYGASKRIAETIIEWYGKQLNLHYVIFRYFNVCGASDDGLVGDGRNPAIHLVQAAVRGALGLQDFKLTCPTVNTPDQTPIRDYINVADLNLAHLKALDYLANGGTSEIINLGTGTGNSVLEIIEQIENITGKTISREKTTPRQGEDAKLIASIAKAKKVLDWEPQHSLKDSVETLVKWYSKHPNGW